MCDLQFQFATDFANLMNKFKYFVICADIKNSVLLSYNQNCYRAMQIYFFISLLGILISTYLLYFNLKRNTSIIYLGLFFVFLSIYSMGNFLIFRSQSEVWISMFFVNMGHFAYLIGPASYLYVRSILTDVARFRAKDWWHLTPAMVSFLFSIPYMLTDYDYKLQIAAQIANDYHFLNDYRVSFLSEYIPNIFLYLTRPFSIFVYALASSVLLIRKYGKASPGVIQSGEKTVKKWLITFNAFLLILILSYSLSLISNFLPGENYLTEFSKLLVQLTNISMFGLMLSPTLFPRILYGLPIVHNPGDTHIEHEPTASDEENSSPVFDDKYMFYLDEVIDENMRDHHLFVQSKLNMNELANFLDIPAYHLKYYFSVYKNQTFKDFCNIYRIDHAKNLMLDAKFQSMTLEAIAISSGFSNRNSFTKTFQKMEGITPSAFISDN